MFDGAESHIGVFGEAKDIDEVEVFGEVLWFDEYFVSGFMGGEKEDFIGEANGGVDGGEGAINFFAQNNHLRDFEELCIV